MLEAHSLFYALTGIKMLLVDPGVSCRNFPTTQHSRGEDVILKDGISRKLEDAGFICTVENPIPHGIQLRLANGAVVNIYESGKVLVQGKCTFEVKQVLGV